MDNFCSVSNLVHEQREDSINTSEYRYAKILPISGLVLEPLKFISSFSIQFVLLSQTAKSFRFEICDLTTVLSRHLLNPFEVSPLLTC